MKRIRSIVTVVLVSVPVSFGALAVACGTYEAPATDTSRGANGGDDSEVSCDATSEPSPRPLLPCDIFEAAGYPCVSAHSTVRVLRLGYEGPLYQLCRSGSVAGPNSCQGEALDIFPAPVGTTCDSLCSEISVEGYANVCEHRAFCEGVQCTITKLYDQAAHASGPQNDLEPAPAGGAKRSPDNPVKASVLPITINGHEAYGMLFRPGMGYRAGCNGCNTPIGTDLARKDEPQTLYMITSVHDANNGCCFDYGNAETTCNNDHNGTMEAVYFGFGVIWGTGSGDGPWVMADLEDGLYPGWDSERKSWSGISTNTSLQHDFVTAIVVGDTAEKNNNMGRFALYGGDAQTGALTEMYDGIRPEKAGYVPMQKQGSLILGIGGDNSDSDGGRFYEGAIVNVALDRSPTIDDLQAAIVAARYGS
jgi:hypothetical protein